MAVLIENPSSSDPVALPPEFFNREVGPREGVVVSDSLADVTAALAGLGLSASAIGTGTGDVTGPGLSTDNAFVRFDGVTGKLIQSSNATLTDAGSAVFSSSATTTSAFSITANAGTSGTTLLVSSNSASATARNIGVFTQANAAANSAIALTVNQASAAAGLQLVHTGNGQSLVVTGPTNTTANTLQVIAADSLTTGGIFRAVSNSADVLTRDLFYLESQNTAAVGAQLLHLVQEAQNTAATIEVNAIAAGTTAGLVLSNTTAASGGTPGQNSPRLELQGQFWDGFVSSDANWNLQVATGYFQTVLDISRLTTRFARFSGAGLSLNPSSGTGTGIEMLERTTRPFTPAATLGNWWVRDDTPCVPVFTDDAGTDFVLNSTSGDFVGPGSSTDNAIVRFDGATGKLGQNSNVVVNDIASTTATIVAIDSADSLTTGGVISAASNSGDTSNRDLVLIDQANIFATGATPLRVQQASTANAVEVVQTATGDAINLTVSANGQAIVCNLPGTTNQAILDINNANSLSTGSRIARFGSSGTNTANRGLVLISNGSALATGTTPLDIVQAANEVSIDLQPGAALTGGGIQFNEVAAVPGGAPSGAKVKVWARNTAPTRLMISNDTSDDLEVGGDSDNTVFGVGAGLNIALPNGVNNTFIGTNAGNASTNGFSNTFVGDNAGLLVAGAIGQAENNTAVGASALATATVATGCTAVGSGALGLATGASNVGLGLSAGSIVSTGTGNVCVGTSAGGSLTTGSSNVVIGFLAGVSAAGSLGRIAIGRSSGGASASATIDDGLFFHSAVAEVASGQVTSFDTATGQMGPAGTTDNLTVNTSGDMSPTSDETQDLGTASLRYQDFFANSVFAHNSTAGTATLTNSGVLAGAFSGVNQGNNQLVSSGQGSVAMGLTGHAGALGGAPILQATNSGSIAMGSSYSSGVNTSTLQATGNASVAIGGCYASSFACTIQSSGKGSFATGYSHGGTGVATITSSGNGSWVHAYCSNNTATASATNAGQFGPGSNSLADSFQFGNAGLRARLTTSFATPQNGDLGVDGSGNVQMRSAGVTHLFNNPTITGSRDAGFAFTFGGDLVQNTDAPEANRVADASVGAWADNPIKNHNVPRDGNLVSVTWNTDSASNLDVMDIYVNGSSSNTVTLTGASGQVVLGTPIALSAGDRVGMARDGAGTTFGNSLFTIDISFENEALTDLLTDLAAIGIIVDSSTSP